MQKRHPKLAEWVKKYEARAKKEPTLGASWGYASAYIIAEAIKRAKSADTDKVIAALGEGFEMEFPWGKVIMRGLRPCRPSRRSGPASVKMDAQGKPVLGDIEEIARQGRHAELRRGRRRSARPPPSKKK